MPINISDSSDDNLDNEPLSKKFKISHVDSSKPSLESLPNIGNFAKSLFETTESKFSPSSSKEPTPPKDVNKGKEIATDIQLEINSLIEEGGSKNQTLELKEFRSGGVKLTMEEIKAQMQEMKRLADLKDHKEKDEQMIKELNPAVIKDQSNKWAEHEAKKALMLEKYNKTFIREDPSPITKISYSFDSKKIPTKESQGVMIL